MEKRRSPERDLWSAQRFFIDASFFSPWLPSEHQRHKRCGLNSMEPNRKNRKHRHHVSRHVRFRSVPLRQLQRLGVRGRGFQVLRDTKVFVTIVFKGLDFGGQADDAHRVRVLGGMSGDHFVRRRSRVSRRVGSIDAARWIDFAEDEDARRRVASVASLGKTQPRKHKKRVTDLRGKGCCRAHNDVDFESSSWRCLLSVRQILVLHSTARTSGWVVSGRVTQLGRDGLPGCSVGNGCVGAAPGRSVASPANTRVC